MKEKKSHNNQTDHIIRELQQINMLLKKILEKENAINASTVNHRIKELEQESITAKRVLKDIGIESPVPSKEMLRQIHHNLRTPLTPIKGYTDMLLLEKFGNLNEEQKQRLLQISANIKQLEKNIWKLFLC